LRDCGSAKIRNLESTYFEGDLTENEISQSRIFAIPQFPGGLDGR